MIVNIYQSICLRFVGLNKDFYVPVLYFFTFHQSDDNSPQDPQLRSDELKITVGLCPGGLKMESMSQVVGGYVWYMVSKRLVSYDIRIVTW